VKWEKWERGGKREIKSKKEPLPRYMLSFAVQYLRIMLVPFFIFLVIIFNEHVTGFTKKAKSIIYNMIKA
jgi:hypothetical protein